MIFGTYALKPPGRPVGRLAGERLRKLGLSGPPRAGSGPVFKCADAGSLFSAEKTSVAYSGEIYNYTELRSELEKAGRKFTSTLDSELVIHAYARWGAGCQRRFNGQWAFALWDAGERRLFCSRDRLGLKPFYYFFGGGVFVFSSRIKAFSACPFIKKEPDAEVVFDYLVLNRANAGNRTFIRGIKQLEAGNSLTLGAGGKPAVRRYYEPSYNPEMGKFDKKRLKEYSAEFLRLLDDSVRIRSKPPHPIGTMLSGGLDSSSVTCLADRGGPGKFKILSILWEGEYKYIKAVSRTARSPHCLIPPSEVRRLTWKETAAAAAAAERPMHMTPFFGELAILKRAKKEKLRALFDGEGGDELLAGYPERYFAIYLNQLIRGGNLPGFLKEFKSLHAGRLREFGITKKNQAGFYRIFLKTQSTSPQLSPLFPREVLARDFYRDFRHRETPPTAIPELNLQRVLHRDTLSLSGEFHTDYALTRRRPLLDHRLVDYALSLPLCYKLHNPWTKYLLRTSLDGILPKSVCWRKKKIGGTVPIAAWKDFLKRNKGELKAVLGGRKFYSAGFLDQKAVLRHFDELFAAAVSPETTDISGLWRFVNLELWLKNNL